MGKNLMMRLGLSSQSITGERNLDKSSKLWKNTHEPQFASFQTPLYELGITLFAKIKLGLKLTAELTSHYKLII
jgi:hypothetical protein